MLTYATADVFTGTIFGGNQLAVIPDARGLSDEQMLAITREFNYSETTFVLPPEDPRHTRRLRIFTPGGEIPFAGHPTIGTAHVLAELGEILLTGAQTRIVFEENIGPVPVTITARDGKPVFAQLQTARLPETGPPAPSRTTLAQVLGLEPGDLLGAPMGAQAVSVGLPFLIVPLRDRKALARAHVRHDLWEQYLRNWWARDLYLFTRDAEFPDHDIRARMYGPGVAVPEDPATGSAAATLAGYLAARDPLAEGTLRWTIEQGFEMGRPSILVAEADKVAGEITAIRVGGESVLVSRGTMNLHG